MYFIIVILVLSPAILFGCQTDATAVSFPQTSYINRSGFHFIQSLNVDEYYAVLQEFNASLTAPAIINDVYLYRISHKVDSQQTCIKKELEKKQRPLKRGPLTCKMYRLIDTYISDIKQVYEVLLRSQYGKMMHISMAFGDVSLIKYPSNPSLTQISDTYKKIKIEATTTLRSIALNVAHLRKLDHLANLASIIEILDKHRGVCFAELLEKSIEMNLETVFPINDIVASVVPHIICCIDIVEQGQPKTEELVLNYDFMTGLNQRFKTILTIMINMMKFNFRLGSMNLSNQRCVHPGIPKIDTPEAYWEFIFHQRKEHWLLTYAKHVRQCHGITTCDECFAETESFNTFIGKAIFNAYRDKNTDLS